MGSSLGRLSADLGREKIPCLSTQPLGCRDPALKDSPGHHWLNTHLHSPRAFPRRRQQSCPVPLMVQQGSPAQEHSLLLYSGVTVRVLLTGFTVCRVCQLLETPSGT